VISSREKILVLGLIIFVALYSNLRIINREIKRFHTDGPMYEANRDKHFAKLNEMLPRNGVVGYFTDQKPDKNLALHDFFLAQYALCPLILVRDARLPFVIADCSGSSKGNCFIDADFVLLKDFDNGLRLYRQKQE
jgi:hypothetical protein